MVLMLDDIDFPDDSTRPKAPDLGELSDRQRRPGRHLAMIHDHFRDNMRTLRQLIDEAARGQVSPEELRERTGAMEMLDNYRRFGTLCGQHCQVIHAHHSIEDEAIFPHLGAKSATFKKVVDRLIAEHQIVHTLLVRLIGAINELVRDPGPANFAATRQIYDKLEEVLLSHFGYEEKSIGDALGYYEIGV